MSRDAALERFRQRGFPTPKLEDWKYTDLSSIAELGARWLETPAEPEAPDHAAIEAVTSAIDADWLVIANGELVASLSTANGTEGLEIGPFELQDQAFDDRLADLNAALLVDGLTVRVSDRHDPAKPIGILVADIASVPRMSQVRIDLRVDANASARVIEYHISSGTDEHYSNTLITLDVADGATVDYVRLQNRALHHSQTARLNVSLAKDSHLNHGAIDIGGRLARNDLAIDIVGAGADASFDGLYIVNEGQHVDNHTRVDHRVGPATSAQEYRGILNGRCRAVWNGKAIVHAGADGTDAEQANHNLLLSERAEIDAKPELEIYADEVKCAHGTTVGQLDENALFYLRSRGLDKKTARQALIHAFATNVANHTPIEELHEHLADLVERRLDDITSEADE